jgi:hypothetical protein
MGLVVEMIPWGGALSWKEKLSCAYPKLPARPSHEEIKSWLTDRRKSIFLRIRIFRPRVSEKVKSDSRRMLDGRSSEGSPTLAS